jgi:signal transduction histidine kinase
MQNANRHNPTGGTRGRLVRRYFLVFAALVGGSLVISILVEMAFRFQESHRNLQLIQGQMAELAAFQIQNYIDDVAKAIRLAAQPQTIVRDRVTEDYPTQLGMLLKNVPAIRDLVSIGLDGREQYRLSRIGPSVPDVQVDHIAAPYFTAARSGQTYFGPIIFPPNAFEPQIIIAVPIEPFSGKVVGVLFAIVNVRYVWEVIQDIHVGNTGYAYVVSGNGTLVAHPDLHLVLTHKDLSHEPQVAAAMNPSAAQAGYDFYKGLDGRRVLMSHKQIPNVGWTVIVERPLSEAYGPLFASLGRTGAILLIAGGIAVAASVMLGRRVIGPIEELRRGAARLEAGDLEARLSIDSGDEFADLANDFNRMADRLQDAYSGLEQKVKERTHALEQSLNEVKGLDDIIRAVSASLDLQKVLQTIVVHATELSKSDAGFIYEFDDVAQVFRLRAGHLLRAGFIEMLQQAPPTFHDSLMGRAAETGGPVQIKDLTSETEYAFRDQLIREGYRCLLAIPAMRDRKLIGGIVVARRVIGGFNERDVDLLHTFANGSTIAIDNARLFLELEQKNAELQLVSQHKSQFLANMSHELRTPLNAVLGYTELLLDDIYGAVPDRMREVMGRIETNGRHLLGLINDVLDLSKIEAGQLTLSITKYSLKELVSGVCNAVESLANAKKLGLIVEVQLNLPAGEGDERRIAQALLNLAGNAIKFTDCGEVKISASEKDGVFTIAVRDSGPGISLADQSKIFEEFQQADTSSTRKKGGTGLGLTITKRIVELHGGKIWVESAPGCGSTFFFTLPVRMQHNGGMK